MALENGTTPRFLLLLPAAPAEGDAEIINGVYGDSIRQVLKEVALASQSSTDAAILEIALACPHLLLKPSRNFDRYQKTQSVVAQIYRLVCTIAAKDKINVEDRDGVNVRVILVGWDGQSSSNPSPERFVPTIQDLAASSRQWQYAFGVENEAGEAMVRAFVTAKSSVKQLNAASGLRETGRSPHSGPGSRLPCVAVGGTFDHLHIGHRLLLTLTVFAVLDDEADSNADRSVIIGITGDELLKNKKYAEHLESWHDRQRAVLDFVVSTFSFDRPDQPPPSSTEVFREGPNGHAIDTKFSNGLCLRCVEIGDPFGPTITEAEIDALIISAETRAGGKAVNDKRLEQGWEALEVLEVDVLDTEEATTSQSGDPTSTDDFAGKISSTEIRRKLSSKVHPSVL